jgi:hypothetical protein
MILEAAGDRQNGLHGDPNRSEFGAPKGTEVALGTDNQAEAMARALGAPESSVLPSLPPPDCSPWMR